MLFEIEILDKPDRRGFSRVLGRLAHTGATVEDAVRSAKANLRTPSTLADSFSMKMRGKEVAHWAVGEIGRDVRDPHTPVNPTELKRLRDTTGDK